MKSVCILLLGLAGATPLLGEPLIPTAVGTTWAYDAVQESNEANSLELGQSMRTEKSSITYKITGTQKLDGKDLFQLAVYRGEAIANTDLVTVDEHGLVCHARLNEAGAAIKFQTPQVLVSAPPLHTGDNWNFNGKIDNTTVSQRYQVGDQEDVQVPAGKFRAWKIRCEQTSPIPAVIERWFVPGTGFVKVTTTVRAPSGELLQRKSLVLKEQPKVTQTAEKKVSDLGSLLIALSKQPDSGSTTTFASDTPAIYARWQGNELPKDAKIHVVWIAEKVPDVASNSEIDDAEAVAPTPNAHGTFTLARPDGGWAPGDYRVEFSVNDAPAGTVKLKIAK